MNKKLLFTAAAFFVLLTALLGLLLGAASLSLPQLVHAVINGPADTAGTILWYVRLPRTAAALLSGAALATAGCIIQNVLNSKLASPGIIGVNAGAGLFVTLCCAFGVVSGWAIAASAFLGALLSAFLVMYLARKTGASRATVILSGVAANSILNALSEAVTTLVPDAAVMTVDFRVGGFSSVAYTRLIPAGILILSALAAVFTLCNELDLLSLGEETAQSLGLPVRKTRTLLLLLTAMLAGAAVSFSGLLGFVGLIVPHAVRRLVGTESRYTLPLCALGGAGFVASCDLAARLLFAPYELPVGILMSVIGGPCFLVLLLKKKGEPQYE